MSGILVGMFDYRLLYFPLRHPRECGDPSLGWSNHHVNYMMVKHYPNLKMDSRIRGNDVGGMVFGEML